MSEMTEHEVPAGGQPGDGPDRAVDGRCPSCGALRPPVVAWCTQCYARFDTPEPGAGGPAAAAPDDPGLTALAGAGPVPAAPELGPAHPVRDDARAPADPQEVQARAQELLARLSAEGGGGDRVRSWSGQVQGRGPKVGLFVLGTVVLTALLFGAMAVLGALL